MKCPTCKKDTVKKYFPFCSERCQLIDLYNWFNEEYCFSEELPRVVEYEEDLPEPFWRNDD